MLLLPALLCLMATPAGAQERIVLGFGGKPGADGVPPPWSFKRWSPVVGLGDYEARASLGKRGATAVLQLRSRDSGFLVGSKRRIDVSAYRSVSWSWRAEVLPRGGSFKQRGTNDQALQILLGFEGGRVVGYIWDTTGPVGASGSGLAWREDVRVIVVRAGAKGLGRWHTERRNVFEDFRRLFGADPPALVGVAIQTNSQHTDSEAAGAVGPITFSRATKGKQ